MIDSHCHLADPKFSSDLPEVLARAKAANIQQMVTIADDIQEANKCQSIAEKNEHIFYTVGIHPHNAKTLDEARDLMLIREHLQHAKCRAVGEIGLDYHYMNSPKQDQLRAFESQLKVACELDVPVVVHTREAIDDTWMIVDRCKPKKIVLHCCTEKWEDVARFVERGYFLSFTGIATYSKSFDIRNTIQQCPLDQIMIETDAPYLPPASKRGQRNEPAFVVEVAECVAKLKKISLEEFDQATTRNTTTFYGLPS